MPRLTHIRTIALVVVTLGVLTGCSNPLSNDELPKVPTQDRAGRLLSAGEARAALPSVASLPAGWAPAKNNLRPRRTWTSSHQRGAWRSTMGRLDISARRRRANDVHRPQACGTRGRRRVAR